MRLIHFAEWFVYAPHSALNDKNVEANFNSSVDALHILELIIFYANLCSITRHYFPFPE